MLDKLLILASLLKLVNNIDMTKFKHSLTERLKFQKTVYLLKVFGFDFGHNFNFYIYGPYSSELARDGFSLAENKNIYNIEPIKFLDKELDEKFDTFKKFLGNNKHDAKWLELISSIHILKTMGKTESEIKNKVSHKSTKFKEEEIDSALRYLKKWKLIGEN